MAAEVGLKGVHVAYGIIDVVIDLQWTCELLAVKPDDFFNQPESIAATAYHVTHQERFAWSFNMEVRPVGEAW
jgi:hypothetical protein